MKQQELDDLLSAFNKKITSTSDFNKKLFGDWQMQKSASVLDKLRFWRIAELIFAVVFQLFLGSFLYANRESLSLVVSAAILMFFVILEIVNNARQLVLISQFDYTKNVTENQAALVALETHIIGFLRLVGLQLPFFLAYILIGFKVFFNVDIWTEGNKNWLSANIVLSALLIPVSIWIYRQISARNIDKKWVAALIESAGGKKLSEAMKFLNEIESFKND